MIKVGFELEMDEGVEAPSPSGLVQGLAEALPKEWWADHREDSWGVKALFALDDDGMPLQSDLRLRTRSKESLKHEADVFKAELTQERKLTASLDAEIGRMELAVNNLTEKNDNQFNQLEDLKQQFVAAEHIIDGLREELFATDKKLKERTESLDVSQHEWKQRGLELVNANAEAQVTAEMVRKIVDAMEGAGYDISGWGNDAELEELEAASTQIEDQAKAARKQLTTLNRFLDEAVTEVSEVENSLDDVSSEIDGLDSLLDNIRTRR